MTIYEQYLRQYNKRWQQRIVKINFVTATVVFILEVVYYFIMKTIGLSGQITIEYILYSIFLPAVVIFGFCIIGWFIVYKSRRSPEVKSLVVMLTMVALCTTTASVHRIIPTMLYSFFVPLAISVVFGKPRIINIVGGFSVAGELAAMCSASMDLRGKDPYFLLDCLIFFVLFVISWYVILLLMKNDLEKRHEIEQKWQLKNEVFRSHSTIWEYSPRR